MVKCFIGIICFYISYRLHAGSLYVKTSTTLVWLVFGLNEKNENASQLHPQTGDPRNVQKPLFTAELLAVPGTQTWTGPTKTHEYCTPLYKTYLQADILQRSLNTWIFIVAESRSDILALAGICRVDCRNDQYYKFKVIRSELFLYILSMIHFSVMLSWLICS